MDPAYHENYRIMGLNIAYYRNLRDMSQEQLGDKLGFEQSYVSRIERAGVGISLDRLFLMAEILNVEPYLLLKPKD